MLTTVLQLDYVLFRKGFSPRAETVQVSVNDDASLEAVHQMIASAELARKRGENNSADGNHLMVPSLFVYKGGESGVSLAKGIEEREYHEKGRPRTLDFSFSLS